MKIVFLDIDGVLNWVGTEDRISGFVGLCPERIQRFNQILDAHPDAKIVVSSTWRASGLFGVYEDFDGLKKLLADRGLRGEIIGHTPIHFGHRGRGNEIREYLDECFAEENPGQTLDAFVVLDDDTEGMEGYTIDNRDWDDDAEPRVFRDLRTNHVVTFWDGEVISKGGYTEPEIADEGGLQDKHIARAIEVLNGKLLDLPRDGWERCPDCDTLLTDPVDPDCVACPQARSTP
jgi:hypothetical protein